MTYKGMNVYTIHQKENKRGGVVSLILKGNMNWKLREDIFFYLFFFIFQIDIYSSYKQ